MHLLEKQKRSISRLVLLIILVYTLVISLNIVFVSAIEDTKGEEDIISILYGITSADYTKRGTMVSTITGDETLKAPYKVQVIDENVAETLANELLNVIGEGGYSKEQIKNAVRDFYSFYEQDSNMGALLLERYRLGFQIVKDYYSNERDFQNIENIIKDKYLNYLLFINIFKEAKDVYNEPREIKIYNYLYINGDKVLVYEDFERLWQTYLKSSQRSHLNDFPQRVNAFVSEINDDSIKGERVKFIEYLKKYHLIDTNKRKSDGYVDVEDRFRDLSSVSWAKNYIETLAEEGIISGVGEGIFAPNNNVKREEFAKMLVSAFGLVDDSANTALEDVSKDKWYYGYVSIAEKLKIVNGIGNNRFGVGSNITRQDMAVMGYRALKVAGYDIITSNEAQKFNDESSIADYAKESVSLMQQAGIISGMDGGRFAPNENATRAQAAKIIYMLTRK